MSPNTDEFWVGAFSMASARAHSLLTQGRPELALVVLDDVLERFAESPILDPYLKDELAPFWRPGKE